MGKRPQLKILLFLSLKKSGTLIFKENLTCPVLLNLVLIYERLWNTFQRGSLRGLSHGS